MEEAKQIHSIGSRKTAVARSFLSPGKGSILVNGKTLDSYFPRKTLVDIVTQPLTLTGLKEQYDIRVYVKGGGLSSQAGAVRHSIARALSRESQELHTSLKKAGFLTRDPRVKERKKYGLKRARKASQYRKR